MGLLDGRAAVVTDLGVASPRVRHVHGEGGRPAGRERRRRQPRRAGHRRPGGAGRKEIEALGGQATPSYDSVSDFEGAGKIVETAVDAFGQLDILVNNAGIVRDRTLREDERGGFRRRHRRAPEGIVQLSHHAAVVMKDAGYGRIINVTSSAGLRGNFGQTNYGAAKAGLMGMTFIWALELGKYGVTVNAVAGRRHPHDRRAVRADRRGATARAEPGPQRRSSRLASERAATSTVRSSAAPTTRIMIFQHPKQIADVARRRMGARAGPTSSTRSSGSTSSTSAWSCRTAWSTASTK